MGIDPVADRTGAYLVRGPLPIAMATVLWGTTGTAATFAPPAASGVSIGAATMGGGGLVLLAVAGRSALAVLRSGRSSVLVVALGAAAIAVYPLAFYSSMAMAGVAIGTVVSIGSSPMFAALFEWAVDQVRLDQRWAVATVVSAAGGVLLVLGGDKPDGVAATAKMPGVLLGLVAGSTYAGYSFAARKLIQTGQRSRAVMGALFGLGSVVLLPVLAVTGRGLLCSTPGLLVAGYLALVPMSMAYLLFGTALRYVGATAATTLSLIEPAIAAVLSVLVVGERLSALAWTGIGLVATGLLILVARRGNP